MKVSDLERLTAPPCMLKHFALTLMLFAPRLRRDHNTSQAGSDTVAASAGSVIFEHLAAQTVEKSVD